MSDWIECGLPWDFIPICLASPDLSSREKEVFGTTYLDESDKYVYKTEMRVTNLNLDFDGSEEEFHEYLQSLNDPEIDEYLKFEKWREDYFEWYDQQPEVIEFNEQNESKKSFIGNGLNKSGTLIELEDGRQFLIGEINTTGGICDHCLAFNREIIIKRYKVLKW